MADPQVLSTLHAKRAEIEAYIARLDKQLTQARHDLAHVNATILLFEAGSEHHQFPVYVQLKRMFSRGELPRLCKEVLANGPQDTRQMAAFIMQAKGLAGR